jgi:transposase
MFEDEARFGRLSEPVRGWAPTGGRPEIHLQRVREYTHVFGAVCPHDGHLVSLILPDADTDAMTIFLAEVARGYPQDHILMFLDRAGWHRSKRLHIPDNLTRAWLPPYSPECNPQELIWRELRRTSLANRDFRSLSAVEEALSTALKQMTARSSYLQSLTGFDWIVNIILNAN